MVKQPVFFRRYFPFGPNYRPNSPFSNFFSVGDPQLRLGAVGAGFAGDQALQRFERLCRILGEPTDGEGQIRLVAYVVPRSRNDDRNRDTARARGAALAFRGRDDFRLDPVIAPPFGQLDAQTRPTALPMQEPCQHSCFV